MSRLADATARMEAMKARRRAEAELERARIRELYPTEIFKPSFPRRLSLPDYPMRAPSGALVTHQVSHGWDGPNFLVESCAEDGTRWLTVHETKPFEYLRSL